MSLRELNNKIASKDARLAVIGLGYVGLPVACEFARVGFDVTGVETKKDRVTRINRGESPIEGNEPGLAELLGEVVETCRFRATSNYQEIRDRDVILIDVETPVDENNIPRYEALKAAIKDLGPVLRPGSLVIIESTIAPGTMVNLVLPLLTESSGSDLNEGFYLGNCPERVMPGKLLSNLRKVSRVVGGMSQETAETMSTLYRHIVQADLDATDCVTAELVKTVENAYRDVQIAFANEVALICEAVGGDVWKVRELVNKSPGRQMHLPGAGVGGHCIPKDPWLLAYGGRDKGVPMQLIPIARNINDSMPRHMLELLQDRLDAIGCDLENARLLVLGYAYLEESDDTRNSPSEILVRDLIDSGADVVIHDPYVSMYDGDLFEKARGADAVLVMVNHKIYRTLELAELRSAVRTPILIDGRHVFSAEQAQKEGWVYSSIGVGGVNH